MNYLVQRGKVRSQVITVPEGLPEILSDITREVLRCQPSTECLCQFIVDYLHTVMESREKDKLSRSIIEKALKMVEDIIDDICLCSMEQSKAREMSLAMEDCFRRFLEQRRCEERSGKEIIRFYEKDMLDEIRERCRFTEQELKTNKAEIDNAYKRFVSAYMVASQEIEGSEALYQYFKERDDKRLEELKKNAAATRIQSSFRGYLVRKTYSPTPKPPVEPAGDGKHDHIITVTQDILDMDVNDPELNAAATKIQHFFRHRVKQSLIEAAPETDQKEPGTPRASPTTSKDSVNMAADLAIHNVDGIKIEDFGEAPADEAPEPVEEAPVEVAEAVPEETPEVEIEPPAPEEATAAGEPDVAAAEEPAKPAEDQPPPEAAAEGTGDAPAEEEAAAPPAEEPAAAE